MLTNYFSLISQTKEPDGTVLSTVELNPDCEVYKGHFPGNPISPGVCNLQMLRECVEHYTNKNLLIKGIKQCRYSALITPLKQSRLQFRATIDEADGGYNVAGTVYDDNETYIDIKFQLTLN